jgi:hypothetical protein
MFTASLARPLRTDFGCRPSSGETAGTRDRPLVAAAFQLRTKPDCGDAADISIRDKPAGSLNGTVDADPAQKPEVQRARDSAPYSTKPDRSRGWWSSKKPRRARTNSCARSSAWPWNLAVPHTSTGVGQTSPARSSAPVAADVLYGRFIRAHRNRYRSLIGIALIPSRPDVRGTFEPQRRRRWRHR